MDEQNKNLILATVLSALVILVWLVFFPPEDPAPVADQTTVNSQASTQNGTEIAAAPGAAGTTTAAGAIPELDPAAAAEQSRDLALSSSERVMIKTARLTGSINLKGGRIDDLSLNDYRVTYEPDSKNEVLLSPAGGPNAYYSLYGWAPAAGTEVTEVPNALTQWRVLSGQTLTETTPITLVWDNDTGLTFTREISVDENFMFTITQSVTNNSNFSKSMFPYGIIARKGEPDTIGFYILHEGVVRASDGKLQEIKYKNMPDGVAAEGAFIDKISVENTGWIGFTDKYWMTTLVPQQGQKFDSVSKYTATNDTYQTDIRLPVVSVAPGTTQTSTTMLFAGAKEWATLRDYENNLNIEQFVDSIDWGMFSFFTKPIFRILHFLNNMIGNMGLAIIGLTLLIKAVLFPLAYKSFVSMAKMKELQPEIEKLKERVGDDKQKLQKEMMALYKEKKANPAAGCLPILVQIPIFFSLYKVIFVTIELRQAPFFGWIRDLSLPDPSSILNLFGLLPYAPPGPESFLAILSIGIFPVLMGITMWMQQKLNPAPTDKTQAQIFAWMPWVFMFMLGRFASGLVIYWVANNTITFTQQYIIMRSQGVKPDVFGNITRGFKSRREARLRNAKNKDSEK